jgi:diguanylate cyclase (GGDEF)-like protein
LVGVVRANITAVEVRKVAGLLRSRADSEEARRLLRRSEASARQMLEREASPRRRVEAATMLATVLVHSGRVAEATDVLTDHIADGDGIDDVRSLVDWNLMWAWVLREQRDLPAALDRASRAFELSIAASDPIAGSLALRERSRIHELAGDTAAALEDLRRADDDARSIRAHRIEVLVEQIARRAQLEAVRRRLQRETEQLGVERRRLTEAVRTDPLTGVGNRRRLMTLLAELRDGPVGPVSMLMLDVDRFKSVNDDHGHEHGDAVLMWLADVLVDEARSSETVCRLGGDEFVVVLPGIGSEEAVLVAESIRSRLAARVWSTGSLRHERVDARVGDLANSAVTVSIGVASGWAADAVGLTADADEALLLAKRNGRNCVHTSLLGS